MQCPNKNSMSRISNMKLKTMAGFLITFLMSIHNEQPEKTKSANVPTSSGLRNVQSVQMHRAPPPPHFWGAPHLTYCAQKKLIVKNYSKL